MIELEKLSECKGAARFGNCSCCGARSQDNDTLIRNCRLTETCPDYVLEE